MRIFLASGNQKKILEMQRILGEQVPDLEVLGIDDVDGYAEPVEDQPTFEGNALLKARAGVAATGLPTVADDSGLCVAALNGMPGVLSARWSGPRTLRDGSSLTSSGTDGVSLRSSQDARNNELLLAQLSDVPDERRDAYFTCAIAWVMPDGRERVVEGRMDGRILREVRGSGGFGYDVLFVADEHADEGLTSAELDPADKDRISHRGRALRELAPLVATDLSDG
ncbi:XTP/dITP diphosphohydrolase [Nocardioides exalbidus]|uniref:dITP/XTP pyrophosphatase n=1 Tax=Nocardioides exalbidus TaxID=402596 RepID=A0A1H4JLJ7_9ACTN|nr:non-canonical purine NTP pyrophosphatase [Nocardioides exalbidus]SEB46835.1 XTP/dITP diphosphohydrolase [Nocardioides exalbidus]